MLLNTLIYKRQEKRIFKSMTNEYLYFSNVGKYFGLSHSFLQKLFAELGNSKFEKKQLRQVFNSMSKNGYYETFNKDTYTVELIRATPVYKSLINESFWNDNEVLHTIFTESELFGKGKSYNDKKVFCCEALVMLIYALSSMSMMFVDYKLMDVLGIYPQFIASIFDEASATNNIFSSDEEDKGYMCDYQYATFTASIIMECIRDTWVYDYIMAILSNSIVASNGFPKGDESTAVTTSHLVNNMIDYINSAYSSITQMFSLMLHDETSMVYFGNLPYTMVETPQTIPYISISKLVLENFGKMFTYSSTAPITDTKSFIDAFSNIFELKDGVITYKQDDELRKPRNTQYSDSTEITYLSVDAWIYATNTISEFESVYNPEPMLKKLKTDDIGEYLDYVLTDLNTWAPIGDTLVYTVGQMLDNYISTDYLLSKAFGLNAVPTGQFTFKSSIEELLNSKQFKMFHDVILYKLEVEMGPDILIRAIKDQLEEEEIGLVNANINYISFLYYMHNLVSEIDDELHICIEQIANNLELTYEDIIKPIENMCIERVRAYFSFALNVFRIRANSYRNIYGSLFTNIISTTSYRVLIEGILCVQSAIAAAHLKTNKELLDTQEKLNMYINKYKQSRSENNQLTKQLVEKTKEHNKTMNALVKSTATDTLTKQIEQLKKENADLRNEPERLNQIIIRQKSRIESMEAKQSNQDQYEQRIKQLEEELERQEKLWESIEDDDTVNAELTYEEKYILSHLRIDMTVLDCESTKRLQNDIMTNSKFNFIPRSKGEATQVNFSQNADIYLLSTNVLGHKDAKKWQQALKNKSFRCVYSTTNGYSTLCRVVLDKYYAMVKQGFIEAIKIPNS